MRRRHGSQENALFLVAFAVDMSGSLTTEKKETWTSAQGRTKRNIGAPGQSLWLCRCLSLLLCLYLCLYLCPCMCVACAVLVRVLGRLSVQFRFGV